MRSGARERRARGAVIGLALSLLTAGPLLRLAHAVSFTVNSLDDAVDATPGNGTCATATGACTLRAAVMEANALEGEDEVHLGASTYTLRLAGRGEDGGATGDLDVTDDLKVVGADVATSIVDGNRLDNVFHVHGTPIAFTDVTIRNGDGAGIRVALEEDAPLSLQRVVVEKNTGSGIQSGWGVTSVGDLVVRDNDEDGIAAISIRLTNATVVRNGGAGVFNGHGSVTLTTSVISENGDAGVLNGGSSAVVDRCTVSGNRGGGIAHHGDSAALTVTDSTVAGNQGTGVVVGLDNGASVIRSTVSGNQAARGGGIDLIPCAGVAVVDSTISGNKATGNGGGIYALLNCGGISLVNSTIADNVADSDADGAGSGGGFFGGDFVGSPRISMDHTLFAANRLGSGARQDCAGFLGSRGHNLLETATGCTVYGETEGNQIGVAANIDALADNGGPTQTHRLLPDSPALDAGSESCGTFNGASITVDQRGVDRPQGDACDIGAFEDACGNGTVDAGEQCDDGNQTGGDCCSAACRYEAGLDVDGDGVAQVARDVVYIARHLFDIPPVPPSFRLSDPGIPADAAIMATIDASMGVLDVDGSGAVGGATDVVYIARHLFGLPPVPPSFRISDPSIPSDGAIAAAIDGLCPLATPPPD